MQFKGEESSSEIEEEIIYIDFNLLSNFENYW